MKLGAILVENHEITKIQKNKAVVVHILAQIKDVDINKMKMDPQFIMFVCEILENQVKNKSMNKMDIFIDVMKEVQLNEEQIEEAKKIVEFLLKNKMIKKTKWSRIIWHVVKRFFLKQTMLA